jgi:16S rRNA (uracil1498-N3)-methyltransferase
MSTTFFYHAEAALHHQVDFDSSEATHISKALRMKSGDTIELTNGLGELFRAELIIDKHRVYAIPVASLHTTDEPIGLHLGIAPTKNPDRIEWLVEKAIELGVGEISLLNCRYSERSRLSLDRLQRVAVSALKQSRRSFLPTIHPVTDFKTWLSTVRAEQCFIAHCEENIPRALLRDVLALGSSTCIAIGPEGDFSPDEIEQAAHASFKSVSLGSARLRTETAALAAVHTYNLKHQTVLP